MSAIKIKANPISLQATINLLNEASKADPKAIRALVDHRVPCNGELADHPTIQVLTNEDGDPLIGILGLFNGLFGVDENVCGGIEAVYNDADPNDPIVFRMGENFTE